MKSITIAGNVTKDATMRTTNNGHKVASFSIAVNGYENGEKTSTFFDVSLWNKRGEQAMQFASKGSKMAVSGELGTREYNGKTHLTVNAHDFTPMGGGKQGNQGGQQGGYGGGGRPSGGGFDIDDDEVPF